MNVLITGITGQVGYNLAKLFLSQSHNVYGTHHQNLCNEFPSLKLDLNDHTINPNNLLQDLNLDLVIHCAAITDVNYAQSNPKTTYQINCSATEKLLTIARLRDIPFVYLSTDFVFNGYCGNYTEVSQPEPISQYGYSKLYGENPVTKYDKGIVLRFTPIAHNLNLSHHSNSLVDWIIKSSISNKKIQLFQDKTFSPISSNEIFDTLNTLLQSNQFGVFHLASEANSIFQAGKLIEEVFDLKPTIEASIFPDNAYSRIRPKYSHLSSLFLPTFDLKTILKNIKINRGL